MRLDTVLGLGARLGDSGTQIDLHILVCEIPRSFERSSPSNFRTQGSFIHINSGKFSNATFFCQIALQNLQRKNLGFSEIDFIIISKAK